MTDINNPRPPRKVTTGSIYTNLKFDEALLEWDTHFGADQYDLYMKGEDETRWSKPLTGTAVNSYTIHERDGI